MILLDGQIALNQKFLEDYEKKDKSKADEVLALMIGNQLTIMCVLREQIAKDKEHVVGNKIVEKDKSN